MPNLTKQRGFSLVELLVVILIILILATISVIALKDQQAKARDAQRINDIRQIRTALEFYFNDEGSYPIENNIILGARGKEKLCAKESGSLVAAETECKAETIYMSKISTDPLSTQNFYYSSTAEGYDITFTTEKPSSLGAVGIYHAHANGIDQIFNTK